MADVLGGWKCSIPAAARPLHELRLMATREVPCLLTCSSMALRPSVRAAFQMLFGRVQLQAMAAHGASLSTPDVVQH